MTQLNLDSNPLKQFTEKYQGEYYPEPLKRVFIQSNWWENQAISGKLEYKNAQMSFSVVEVGGADPYDGPLRLKMYLNSEAEGAILIYPVSFWSSVFSNFRSNKHQFPKTIHKKYRFIGHDTYIKAIRDNQRVLDLLERENISLLIKKDRLKEVLLTPAHGYDSVEQLENFANILVELKPIVENCAQHSS